MRCFGLSQHPSAARRLSLDAGAVAGRVARNADPASYAADPNVRFTPSPVAGLAVLLAPAFVTTSPAACAAIAISAV